MQETIEWGDSSAHPERREAQGGSFSFFVSAAVRKFDPIRGGFLEGYPRKKRGKKNLLTRRLGPKGVLMRPLSGGSKNREGEEYRGTLKILG